MRDQQRLDEIKTRCEAATRGPWEEDNYAKTMVFSKKPYGKGMMLIAEARGWRHLIGQGACGFDDEKARGVQDSNSAFITHSRDDIPFLRNLVRELQACNARQAQLLKDVQVGWAATNAEVALLQQKLNSAPYALFVNEANRDAAESRSRALQEQVERLTTERDNAYMDGVKKAIYEIFKEADVPGSQAIRDSGDTDDGMCEQAAKLLTDPKQAFNTLRNWCKKSNCVDYNCPLELDGLHCLCHEPQPSMWPELKEGGPADE